MLQTSENTLGNTRTLTAAEEKALQAMSLEEVIFFNSLLFKNFTHLL